MTFSPHQKVVVMLSLIMCNNHQLVHALGTCMLIDISVLQPHQVTVSQPYFGYKPPECGRAAGKETGTKKNCRIC